MNKEISYFKKALVMLMAVMMVFTMMPSMAWADESNAVGNEASSDIEWKKDGNIEWYLDDAGILTLRKATTETDNDGSMNNYKIAPAFRAPWLKNGSNLNIKKVILKEGMMVYK